MFDLFGSVRVLLKLERICTDNNVFRLHYKATVIMLVVSSLLVTSKQYFGDPIDCIVKKDSIPSRAIDTYCWVHSTFTVVRHLKGKVGQEVAHPGVAHHIPEEDMITYHKYYQWVCFMLFFQAVLFSIPRHLWKIWEGGRLRMLAVDLGCPLVGDTWNADRKKMLVEYLTATTQHTHNFYAARFAICEFLNLINVVGQIYFLDLFLDGMFRHYGPSVALFSSDEDVNPMDKVFPKMTKCTFYYFGPSGTLQLIDALCVLPLNIVNEKIFVFLWFWYVILAIVSAVAVFYRAVLVVHKRMRVFLLLAQCRYMPRSEIDSIVQNISFGDWFFLNQLGKNLNPVIFREVLLELASQYDTKVFKQQNTLHA
ncbi:innexin inx2 [Anabrus simplex]|uniref:innexin inx2 n=1 Tax=Anabrus simplex TaxID=316456 RepID=UPI0035A3957B